MKRKESAIAMAPVVMFYDVRTDKMEVLTQADFDLIWRRLQQFGLALRPSPTQSVN